MDFSAWSPSHLLVALLAFATIIGQAVAVLSRLKTTATQHSKEIKQLSEQIIGVRDELRNEIRNVRDELHIEIGDVQEHLRNEIRDVRGEIRDMRLELSKMNQNHIDHLSHHES